MSGIQTFIFLLAGVQGTRVSGALDPGAREPWCESHRRFFGIGTHILISGHTGSHISNGRLRLPDIKGLNKGQAGQGCGPAFSMLSRSCYRSCFAENIDKITQKNAKECKILHNPKIPRSVEINEKTRQPLILLGLCFGGEHGTRTHGAFQPYSLSRRAP